jgi:hypothetical protein
MPPPSVCDSCKKEYKNITLHMVKKHKTFKCVSCEAWRPLEEAISSLGDKNEGKLCKKAMCKECFT